MDTTITNAPVTISNKFEAVENAVNAEVLERTKEVHGSLVAILAQKHVFFLGAPGIAKSYLVRRLVNRIDFGADNDAYFQWLLTKYTTPEEVFGPPSLADLEQGHYRRNTEQKLPVSKIAFLDEIFKANSSILNALLTIMNERLFFNNGDTEQVPLSTIFGASNEMPEDEGLHALFDRLHLRFRVEGVQESGNFVRMLSAKKIEVPDAILTWDDITAAQAEVRNVILGGDVIEALKTLRDNLYREGVEPSDRRFVESLDLIRAEAWLAGRSNADIDDMRILRHVMWTREQDIRTVERLVLELANPIDKEAHDLLERVESLDAELKKVIQEADNAKAVAQKAVEIHSKLHKAKGQIEDLEKRSKEAGRKSEVLGELNRKFVDVAKRLMKDAFGMEGDLKI